MSTGEPNGPIKRIVAVGDLHGSINAFLEIVERLGLVSADLELQMPSTELVFLGDVCDRGYNSKDIYKLIMDWQREAPKQGSHVWFIIGNHEAMNTFGLRHYNTAEEYLSFDPASGAAGSRAHSEAFAPGGWLYRWLAEQHAILRLGGFIFGHGDLPPALAEWSVEEINERTMGIFRNLGIRSGTGAGRELPGVLFSPDQSILWCRLAQLGGPRNYRRLLEGFLARNDACAYVCGHTPSEEGHFRLGHGNRYLCIDTAMTFERQGVGRKSALIIEGGRAVAAYLTATDVVFREVGLSFSVPDPR